MEITLLGLQEESMELSLDIKDLKAELTAADIPADKLSLVPNLVKKQMRLDTVTKQIDKTIRDYAGELK